MTSTTTVERPVPARGRWRKRLLIFLSLPLLIVLVMAAILGFFALVNAWRWQEAFGEADRLDPGWRWEELKAQQPELADEDNAAAQIEAFARVRPLEAVSQGLDGAFEREHPDFVTSVVVAMSPATAAQLRAELAAAATALEQARKLADAPRSRANHPLDGTYFSKLGERASEPRALAQLLKWDARLRCQDGDVDGALASCRGILHAGRASIGEPLLIGHLVRAACQFVGVKEVERVLGQGEPSEEALAAMQDVLEVEDREPGLLTTFRGERAFAALPSEVTGVEEFPLFPRFGSSGFTYIRDLVHYHLTQRRQRLSESDRIDYFRFLTQIMEEAKRYPTPEQDRHFFWSITRMEPETTAKASDLPIGVHKCLNGLKKLASVSIRQRAVLRCALVAIAAERYHRAKGHWPPSHEALKPDYLKCLPQDPFTGNDLILRRAPDGLLIYSLGYDGTDDSGNLSWNPLAIGTDIGLKLWDVRQRRQPAKK